MKIVFFTFYFPPDLSAGSFRSIAFSQSLKKRMKLGDKIDIITSHPNRYSSFKEASENLELNGQVKIYRAKLPSHKNGIFSQAYSFTIYAHFAFKLSKKIKPNLINQI